MDMTNEQYYDLIRPYEDARRLLETRLEILNHSLYGSRAVCGPIHNMQNRIKAKKSIEDKLKRLGQRDGVTNARDYHKMNHWLYLQYAVQPFAKHNYILTRPSRLHCI